VSIIKDTFQKHACFFQIEDIEELNGRNKKTVVYITPEQYSIELCIDCSTLQVFERNETSNINTGLMRVCV